MRLLATLALFLLSALALCAQRENNTWYFGHNAGLTFDGGTATAVRGPIFTAEGSAVWSDPVTGRVMFSTDGQTVYRADGSIMPNGTGLLGGFSSTQSALIVPDPASPLTFYVFCAGDLSWSTPDNPMLSVNVVDFSTDPAGVVTTKNDTLLLGTAEKLTATMHCNGRSFWVVTHDRDLPKFYAFQVTRSGIGAPVVSTVGQQYVVPPTARGGPYGQGMLKFTASGTRLAMASPFAERCEVFNFDAATGIVSDVQLLGTGRYYYGLSFSPNEQLLYASTWSLDQNVSGEVLQIPLNGAGPPVVVGQFTRSSILVSGGMQCGPDRRIYIADGGAVDVIMNPDGIGASCVYRDRAFTYTDPVRSYIGMPNVIESFLDPTLMEYCAPPLAAMILDTMVCVGSCITIDDRSTIKPTSWEWTFNGGTPSTSTEQRPPKVCYDRVGTYSVRLVAGNRFGFDTVLALVVVRPLPTINAGRDLVLCDSAYGRLSATGAVRYEWEPSSSMANMRVPDPIVRPFTTTTYVVHGWSADGCESVDSVTVVVRLAETAPIVYTADPVNGKAGDSVDVVIRRTTGTVYEPTTIRVAMPARALYGPRVIAGEAPVVERPASDTFIVYITDNGATDTVGIIRAQILLFSGTDTLEISGRSPVSCDSVVGQGAGITSTACGIMYRIVELNGQPMAIVEVTENGRRVLIEAQPRTTVELGLYDVQGREVCRTTVVMSERQAVIDLPCELPAIGYLRLRSDTMIITRSVILR
ncbi:MAG: PKD domain-containing protein [Ignavibacteriae bacterium]|nr:MAG: PKD domain-containing protein [Ignavibacteriota bacterium]